MKRILLSNLVLLILAVVSVYICKILNLSPDLYGVIFFLVFAVAVTLYLIVENDKE